MKKLMTMLAAVGMAFGLFADDPDPIVDTNDFASVTQEAFSNDTQWTYNGAATKPIDKVWVANSVLNLATGSDKVQRTFVSGGAATVTDAIYFDANINFEDPFDEAPVVTDANAKIAAFVLDNSGIIEELGDAAAVAASTNLYVIAGYYNSETTEWEKRAFMFATSELEGIASKTAKRLTIKAYGDVMAGAATRMGFRFFLNGNTDIKPALAVKYVFPINEDGSIDFTTFIAADDSTTPYLGEGVKASLEAAVRSRCTDQTLVLGLTEFAGALRGIDLAGKGKLAKFTLTTASPEFIDGDSSTVTLDLVDTVVTVTGAGVIDYDQTTITFAGDDNITVTATYTNGDDIVKWTLNDGEEFRPANDSYTWKPNNNDVLAISAKAAGAFVIDAYGTVTPFENFFDDEAGNQGALGYVNEHGGTLKLAANAVSDPINDTPVEFDYDGEIILDLAGKTIKGSDPTQASIIVYEGTVLTITNSTDEIGHVAVPYGSEDGGESYDTGDTSISSEGTLVIADGIMDGKVVIEGGEATITGGTFDGEIEDDSELLETIGGNFNTNVFAEATDVPGVQDGYDIVDTEVSGYWTVKEHVAGTVTVTFTVEVGVGVASYTVQTNEADVANNDGSYTVESNALVTVTAVAAQGYKDPVINPASPFTADTDGATVTIAVTEIQYATLAVTADVGITYVLTNKTTDAVVQNGYQADIDNAEVIEAIDLAFPEGYELDPSSVTTVTLDAAETKTIVLKKQLKTYAVTFSTNNVQVVEAATTAQYGQAPAQIPTFEGGAWDVDPTNAVITCATNFNYTIQDTPTPTPVDPGEEKKYDTTKEAEDAAKNINDHKDTMINVPTEASGDKAAYLARVAAKVEADGLTVVVDIADDAKDDFQGELDTEIKKTTVAAALTDATVTKAAITTVAGFYYWIEGGVEVGTINQNGEAKIGTGSTIELAKPALGTTDKAFYKLAVGVKAP